MTSSPQNSTKSKKRSKVVPSKRVVFHADTDQTQFLVKAGRVVSEQAIREANALGLEIMYIEDGVLYREKDGKREVISNIQETKSTKYKLFKKGVTLYVKK